MASSASLLAILPFIVSVQAAPKRPDFPDCLKPKGSPAPASFEELRACQDDARGELLERARRRGKELSGAERETLDEHQRAEARRFMARSREIIAGPAQAAVERDGGKLTPDTMKELQNGVRAAKGEGLELGIDPKLEKELLERDFDADKTYFQPGAAGL